jgi:hypothetical protein
MQFIKLIATQPTSYKGSVAFRPYLAISLALSSLNRANLTKRDTSFEVENLTFQLHSFADTFYGSITLAPQHLLWTIK